jgi:hypothetical protein
VAGETFDYAQGGLHASPSINARNLTLTFWRFSQLLFI